MKTILLACAGGMSTSLLVSKMREAAEKSGEEYEISATGGVALPDEVAKRNPDVILLGPQVAYMLNKVEKYATVPVAIINMQDYGTMNGAKVLGQAKALMAGNPA